MLCIKHNEIPLPSNFIYLIFLVAKRCIFIPCLANLRKNLNPIQLFRDKIKTIMRHTNYTKYKAPIYKKSVDHKVVKLQFNIKLVERSHSYTPSPYKLA